MDDGILIAIIILIALVVGLAYRRGREDGRANSGAPGGGPARGLPERAKGGVREGYGPPPGMYRALSPEELPDRGWPEYPYEYSGTSAASVSHMIERSA
jgi:hypothetical protein